MRARFRFALNAPRRITHIKKLRDSEHTLEVFAGVSHHFGARRSRSTPIEHLLMRATLCGGDRDDATKSPPLVKTTALVARRRVRG